MINHNDKNGDKKHMSKKSDNPKQERITNYENQRDALLQQGYLEEQCIINVIKINIVALLYAIPWIVILFVISVALNHNMSFELSGLPFLFFIIGMVLSIPIHEFLHGLGWYPFCKNGWKSIGYGVMWKYLTPYCHCKEPLRWNKYIVGGLLPFIILGFGISFLGIVLNSSVLLFLGFFNILAAGGDLVISQKSIKYKNDILLDHPSECGFIAFRTENNR